jgi:hypothetical protein
MHILTSLGVLSVRACSYSGALPPPASEGSVPGCQGILWTLAIYFRFYACIEDYLRDAYSNTSWCIVGQGMFAVQTLYLYHLFLFLTHLCPNTKMTRNSKVKRRSSFGDPTPTFRMACEGVPMDFGWAIQSVISSPTQTLSRACQIMLHTLFLSLTLSRSCFQAYLLPLRHRAPPRRPEPLSAPLSPPPPRRSPATAARRAPPEFTPPRSLESV